MPTDHELFLAARAVAPHNGASSAPVARLRAYLHQQLVLNRTPDDDAGDVAGRLLDAIEEYEFPKVGDYLRGGSGGIHWMVLEVLDDEGTLWRRAFGDDRFAREDDGTVDYSQEYDWMTEGGRCTTSGVLFYAPLQVRRVVTIPGSAS